MASVKVLSELDVEEQEKHNFGRRTLLRDIELKMQAKWAREKTYQIDAPVPEPSVAPVTVAFVEEKMRSEGKTPDPVTIAFTLGYLAGKRHLEEGDKPKPEKKKFFASFPYPYMNGRMHLGHAFTVTKAEFAARYNRLKGKDVLFPFAFHCTGMPIQGSANKLKGEIATFGLENCRQGVFEDASATALIENVEVVPAKEEEDETSKVGLFKGKKTKLVAKTGQKTTWEILLACGVDIDEVPKFVDATYWLKYFPPLGRSDLKLFGLNTDWRRSFVTTDINPYYDAFIQWHFRTLKSEGKVIFGNRPTIYSPVDGQACADHGRSVGEGANPQMYTLIKIRVLEASKQLKGDFEGCNVFLIAATLRPETMHGQTNCFVLPDGEYQAYDIKPTEAAEGATKEEGAREVFICGKHAARNMAFQGFFSERGEVKPRASYTGWDLLGLALSAPHCPYEKVYALPLLTIKMDKGTGIVTSVPSDAPDDYIALRDLQQDEALRKKYKVTAEMVNFEVVPIINIPGGDAEIKVKDFGNTCAVAACLSLKIKNQHDKVKLKIAKHRCYLKGFETGVMLVGAFKGMPVKDAKDKERLAMVAAGTAREYWEPDALVVSRTNDKCVVANLDQWYLPYGEEVWREAVLEHVNDPASFETYGDAARKQYVAALGWMGKWACSRSFGLGTKVPWDTQFVIESLSDSTVYMSYYTVAHLLQGEGNMDGTKTGPSGILPAQLTDDVWDFIFKKGASPKGCSIPMEMLKKMRGEFEYWYPLDLRVSGKDLIRNHLTMSLYNHACVWKDRPEMWPRSYYANGHVMVDATKMSKSKGNFITLENATCSENMFYKRAMAINVPEESVTELAGGASASAVANVAAFSKDANVAFSLKGESFSGVVQRVRKIKPKKPKGKKKKKGPKVPEVPAVIKYTYDIKHDKKGQWIAQAWSTDSVRLALGDAGDTMDDSNFESETANNCILRLTKELEWFDEVLAADHPVRGEELRTVDKIFLLKMAEFISKADEAYTVMRFKMAIKWGFYELQLARDDYRNYHRMAKEPMNGALLRRYVQIQAIVISPVCPHWAEWIWTTKLGNTGTVTNAPWPDMSTDIQDIDATMVMRRATYIDNALGAFRVGLAPPKKRKKKKKKGADADDGSGAYVKPNAAFAYVRKKYEQWREVLILRLRDMREGKGAQFPKDIMKRVVTLVKEDEILSQQNAKMLRMKAAFIIKHVNNGDESFLELTQPFDEIEVLRESSSYLMNSLDLRRLEIFSVEDPSSPDAPNGAKEGASPGEPKVYGFSDEAQAAK